MIRLSAVNETFEILTSTVSAIDVIGSYDDITISGGIPTGQTPASFVNKITTATTTTIVAAPAASTTRVIHAISISNVGTATNVVTVQKDVGGTNYVIDSFPLLPGEALSFRNDAWVVRDASGRLKVADAANNGTDGYLTSIYKVGTASEAAGSWYSWHKDTGFPGAWAPGTPGLNGRATDGTTAADNGCFPIKTPTGSNYITRADFTASVACSVWLFDILWINTGLVVTTTTAQAITPVAIPARDFNGSTNGEGVWAGLLVTTATTNAGVITNMTISYTNSDGTAGRTATLAAFPITAVIGTVVWFQLAAGDKGVRSVQSVTLGTSLVAGAVSLILARPVFNQAMLLANVGGQQIPAALPGTRSYTGACILPMMLASATTATVLSGSFTVRDA